MQKKKSALLLLEKGDEKEMNVGRRREEAEKEPGFLIPKCLQLQLQACQPVLFPFTGGGPSQLPHYSCRNCAKLFKRGGDGPGMGDYWGVRITTLYTVTKAIP